MITIHFSRDSVCAADDVDSHEQTFTVPAPADTRTFASDILRQAQLPLIQGGKATWCLAARVPFAVAAQQWSGPQPLFRAHISQCVPAGATTVSVHASYLAQQDPDLVVHVLNRVTLPG